MGQFETAARERIDPDALISAVRADAVSALQKCISPSGLLASGRAYGHHQIWARDSMIALLGASLSADDGIVRALDASLATLAACQTATGLIPNNVDPQSGVANYRAYADSGLWFAIGSSILGARGSVHTSAAAERALRFYDFQDVDQCGLISIQESSDWQDLFATRGKALYVNCLYALALRLCGQPERSAAVAAAINRVLWHEADGSMLRHVAHTFSTPNADCDSLGRERWIPGKRMLRDESYYLPFISFRETGEWFDTLGNLTAILAGVANAEQSRAILEFIARHDLAVLPAKAIYPPVMPGEREWREYYGTLNQPHHYHNGGVWPFIGGFHVAALVKCGAREEGHDALVRLAELNRRGSFNEWHHGVTGEQMGAADQAWSAGMFLYACECVRQGRAVHL